MYVTQIDRFTVEIEQTGTDPRSYLVTVTDDDGAELFTEEKEAPQAWAGLNEAEVCRRLATEITVPATAGE